MRKNLIILFFILVLSLCFISPSLAAQETQQCTVKAIYYDPLYKGVFLELVNEQGEGFICSIHEDLNIPDYGIIYLLNKTLQGKQATVIFNNMDTKSIYDDEIISYKVNL